jgi:ABC-type dipeptide/oligopeptide/nickel transport system permease subunit
MTDATLSLQSDADQRAIAALRRKNAVWRRILRDPAAAAAALFLFLIVAAAILAPWIAPFDPYASNMRLRLCPIGSDRCAAYLLGADNQGRDMVSRILFGLRATLGIGVLAVAVGGGLGALIGLSAAYFKRLDQPLMRLVDVLLSFPSSCSAWRSLRSWGRASFRSCWRSASPPFRRSPASPAGPRSRSCSRSTWRPAALSASATAP